jgi:dUTP pyrophosphatase
MGGDCEIPVRLLREGSGDLLPAYQTEGAAGMDLRACIDGEVVLPPLGRALIPTGISMALPRRGGASSSRSACGAARVTS